MERRTVIKTISLSLGSLASLPTWAAGWSHRIFDETRSFDNEKLLAALVETFIPTTDTLGAKGLGVHQFVQKMIADCYEDYEKQYGKKFSRKIVLNN